MIPQPTPSLVINYYYLWQHEAKAGWENGTKNRPCVIIATTPVGKATSVIVAPITHTKPNINLAVPIPPKVMAHLGMDDAPSYIICTEVNEFIWPGFDLTPLQGDAEKFVYGFLPPRLFNDTKEKIIGFKKWNQLQVVSRNE